MCLGLGLRTSYFCWILGCIQFRVLGLNSVGLGCGGERSEGWGSGFWRPQGRGLKPSSLGLEDLGFRVYRGSYFRVKVFGVYYFQDFRVWGPFEGFRIVKKTLPVSPKSCNNCKAFGNHLRDHPRISVGFRAVRPFRKFLHVSYGLKLIRLGTYTRCIVGIGTYSRIC